jgi:hypothetical protein
VDGVLRGIAGAGAWALASACGPTLVDGPDAVDSGNSGSASAGETTSADDGSASGSGTFTATATATETASATATETASATATETATATATETATVTATLDDSGTGVDAQHSAISVVSCQDDGTVAWLVEVHVEGPFEGCSPKVGLGGILRVGIDEWDGEAGTHVIGESAAVALYGVEALSGTFTLDISSPYHPSDFEYEFTGSSVMLVGAIDLTPCSYVDELPCEASTTG